MTRRLKKLVRRLGRILEHFKAKMILGQDQTRVQRPSPNGQFRVAIELNQASVQHLRVIQQHVVLGGENANRWKEGEVGVGNEEGNEIRIWG